MFNNLSLYDKQIIFNDFAVASSEVLAFGGQFYLCRWAFRWIKFWKCFCRSSSESRQNGKLNFKLQDLNVPSGASDKGNQKLRWLSANRDPDNLLELTGQMGQLEVINKGQFIADLSNSSFINTSIESNLILSLFH